jgi:uncharacterized protein YacL
VENAPGAGGSRAAGQPSKEATASETTWTEKVKTIGGLVAVVIGVVVVGVIAIIALIKSTEIASTIASSAAGVIATIVGAYFGVKVGTDQSKAAIEGQQAEAAKAQVYAAHLPPADAAGVLEMAESAARAVKGR